MPNGSRPADSYFPQLLTTTSIIQGIPGPVQPSRTPRTSPGSARQNKIFQWRQAGVECVERIFEPFAVRFADYRVAGHAQFATEVEEIVLHVAQTGADMRGQILA